MILSQTPSYTLWFFKNGYDKKFTANNFCILSSRDNQNQFTKTTFLFLLRPLTTRMGSWSRWCQYRWGKEVNPFISTKFHKMNWMSWPNSSQRLLTAKPSRWGNGMTGHEKCCGHVYYDWIASTWAIAIWLFLVWSILCICDMFYIIFYRDIHILLIGSSRGFCPCSQVFWQKSTAVLWILQRNCPWVTSRALQSQACRGMFA